MSEPISYSSTSTNFAFPLLFAGQAQKEPFVNQSLAMIDALLPRVINASLAAPPLAPTDGESYLVTSPASGDWAGSEDKLALRVAGAWQMIEPVEGMAIYDQSMGQVLFFRSAWQSATEPSQPAGGSVIDVEARAALSELTDALRNLGIFPAS